jgi:lysophospholipase L1-like esterase
MARTHQAYATVRLAALGLIGLAALAAAHGQEAAPATPPAPAPFSRDCQLGSAAVVGESPLPNVAAALQRQRAIKILAIGASASGGRRGHRGTYTDEIRAILEQAIKGLDVIVVNRGVSGELAPDAAVRIKKEVALTRPDLVLWQVGTNDALAYLPLEQLETTVLDTVRWLKEHKVDVVLVGLQYVDRMAQDPHYIAVRELLRKVATQENVLIIRRYEAMRLLAQASGSGGGLLPDEFAPSEAGYICLSQYVARAITLGIFGSGLRARQPPGQP